jgi:hypothetical protein
LCTGDAHIPSNTNAIYLRDSTLVLDEFCTAVQLFPPRLRATFGRKLNYGNVHTIESSQLAGRRRREQAEDTEKGECKIAQLEVAAARRFGTADSQDESPCGAIHKVNGYGN